MTKPEQPIGPVPWRCFVCGERLMVDADAGGDWPPANVKAHQESHKK